MAAPRDGERRRSGSRHVGSASFVSIARSSGGTRVLDEHQKNVLLTVQADASSDILRLVTVESEVWLFGVSGWARGSVGHAQTSGLASLASSRTFFNDIHPQQRFAPAAPNAGFAPDSRRSDAQGLTDQIDRGRG